MRIGALFLKDAYYSRRSCEDFELFDDNDIQRAFDMVQALNFTEEIELTDRASKM